MVPGPIIFTNPQNFNVIQIDSLGNHKICWLVNGHDLDNDSFYLVPRLPAVLYKQLSST